MVKYEYKTVDSKVGDVEKHLNELGESGWDLLTVNAFPSNIMQLILKRPQVAGTLALLG
jgi:hypothetical protein